MYFHVNYMSRNGLTSNEDYVGRVFRFMWFLFRYIELFSRDIVTQARPIHYRFTEQQTKNQENNKAGTAAETNSFVARNNSHLYFLFCLNFERYSFAYFPFGLS